MSITDFLLARIAEDEQAARQASWSWSRPDRPDDPEPDHWKTPAGTPTEVAGPMRNVAGADTAAIAIHIARQDPARVIADCAAKRSIIKLVRVVGIRSGTFALESAIHRLAAVYADHPDYDPAWSA